MKTFNQIAFGIVVFMFLPLAFTFLAASLNPRDINNNSPPNRIIEEFESVFKFELASHEMLSIRFFPGMLQARISISFIISNVESKEHFLSRFHGGTIEDVFPHRGNISHLFENNNHHEFSADMSFNEDESTVIFHVYNGGFPELNNIFVYMSRYRYFTYLPLKICVIIQGGLMLYLLVYRILQRKKTRKYMKVHNDVIV